MQKGAANQGGRAIRGAWMGLFVCLFWDCGDCWMCVWNVRIWIWMRYEIWIWHLNLRYEIWIWVLNLRSESELWDLKMRSESEIWIWRCKSEGRAPRRALVGLFVCLFWDCGDVYERANMNLRSEIWIWICWIWDLNLNAQISRGARPAEPGRVCLFVWLFWDCWMCFLNVQIWICMRYERDLNLKSESEIWDLNLSSESEIWIWVMRSESEIWIWDLNLRSESERANLRGALRGEP